MLLSKNISLQRAASPALFFPDLSINKGEHVLLLGPSGSGKTTLLSIIAGMLKPTSGDVLFEDTNLYAQTNREIDRLRGANFGLIFQTLHLLPTLTIRQNVEITAKLGKKKQPHGEAERLLGLLGLADKIDRKPDALSQGEQQRAAIARAVINRPSILLADEPTSALDDANALKVIDLLIASAKDVGAALVISTHDSRVSSRFSKIIEIKN